MASIYIPQKASFAERFGIIVGGGALLAILSGQVVFVVWLAGW